MTDIQTAGRYVLVADGTLGVRVYDALDPTNLVYVEVHNPGGGGRGLAVAGNLLYLLANRALHVVDATNPQDLRTISSTSTSYFAEHLHVYRNFAIASIYEDVEVFDLSDPTNVVRVARFAVGERVLDVFANESGIALAAYQKGLVMVPSLPGVLLSMQVHHAAGTPVTIETATSSDGMNSWTGLLTTNSAVQPLRVTDYGVSSGGKLYRARQP
jgi:hypothetical protein